MYYVVETSAAEKDDRETYIIPENWMNSETGTYLWPPVPSYKAETMVKAKKNPDAKTWQSFNVKILKAATTYQDARKWLMVVVYKSDLESEDSSATTPKRPRRTRNKRLSVTAQSGESSGHDSSGEEGRTISHPPSFNLGLVTDNNGVLCVTESELEEVQKTPSDQLISSQESDGRIASTSQELLRAGPSQGAGCLKSKSKSAGVTFKRPGNACQQFQADNGSATELLKKIAEDTAIIKQTLFNLDSRVSNLERDRATGRTSTHGEFHLLSVCHQTVDDFKSFDEQLSADDLDALKSEMISCGGDSVVEFVGRILRKLMTNTAAKRFSLWGQKDNENFSKTNTWETLKRAVLSTRKADWNEKAVETATMNWFRHAGDRLKSDEQKRQPQAN